MPVKEWIRTPVITVNINDSLDKTINPLNQHAISTLPVMDERKLAGPMCACMVLTALSLMDSRKN